MRVLFLESSPIWRYGLPNGFKDAGACVEVSGPLTKRNIPQLISRFHPDLVITIGWTEDNIKEKQEWISKFVHESGVPLIYWATEDSLHTKTWSLPFINKVKPDFVFSICRETVNDYKKLGIPSAYMDFGYHASVHSPYGQRRYNFIAVVANAYPNFIKDIPQLYRRDSMQTLIRPLLQKDIRIDFWGDEWDKMESFFECTIPKEWIHGHLHYTEANKAYGAASITLGLQNSQNQVTQRTYEILGSGGLLLTSDTPEIRRLFKPGHDLVVSSSPEETVDLIKYYLKNPDKCEQIRSQGRLAVLNHSYKHRAEYMINVLRKNKILS